MSALLIINFAGAIATGNNVGIALENGTIAIGETQGVSVALATALTNIIVVSSEVTIATVTGAEFIGSIAIAISWTASSPTVCLNNVQNNESPSTVTWPTASGPTVQELSPGEPLTLAGIVSS